MLLSLPSDRLSSTSTVPQPDHVSPVMPKLLLLTVRAVKSGVEQVIRAPFDVSCTGPTTTGSALVSRSVGGSSSVVVPGPVAVVICCARSLSLWICMLAGGAGGAGCEGVGKTGLGDADEFSREDAATVR